MCDTKIAYAKINTKSMQCILVLRYKTICTGTHQKS